MSHALDQQRQASARDAAPLVALDAMAIRDAYRRWAGFYDTVFGGVSSFARKRTVSAINALPGRDVLEVGVGTGLALPLYRRDKLITGIDLSTEMLEQARQKVAEGRLHHVAALEEMDAEATSYADHSFDIAVAMFVASVVPNPKQLLAEMRRVVRPGGNILFVNHFAASRGPRWWVERAMAPASRRLGWHPDFMMEALLTGEEIAEASIAEMPPGGIFTLVRIPN